MWRTLLQSSLWLSLGILAGRLAGFVREAALAATYGADREADVAVLMLTVPDLLVNLLVGGALSVVLIPEFRRHGGLRGACLFAQASLGVALAAGLVAALCALLALPLTHLLAPGFASADAARAAAGLAWVVWAIPLTALAGVTTAYLQAHDRFVVPAFGTLIFNLVLVAALFTVVPAHAGSLAWLAAAVLVAAAVRWLAQLARAPRLVFTPRCLRLPLLRAPMLGRYGEALAAGGLLFLLPVLMRAIASYHGAGALAVMNYASKLVEFPLGACITVLSVALFPRLADAFARAAATTNSPTSATSAAAAAAEEAHGMVSDGLALVLVLSCALAATLGWYALDVARVVFGVGAMPAQAVAEVGLLAAIGMASLPAQGASSVLVAAFNARGDTRTPLIVNALAVPAFALAGWWAFGAWGLIGLMAALTGLFYVLMLVQAAQLQARVPGVVPALARMLGVLAVVMALGFAPLAWAGDALGLPGWGRVLWAGVATAWLMALGIASQPRLRPLVGRLLRR